jgi:choline dehydrogenase-like flavoprotein
VHLEAPEIVIVGGGIAGSALATVLARAGLSIVVLERELAHIDQVRGEYHGCFRADYRYVVPRALPTRQSGLPESSRYKWLV